MSIITMRDMISSISSILWHLRMVSMVRVMLEYILHIILHICHIVFEISHEWMLGMLELVMHVVLHLSHIVFEISHERILGMLERVMHVVLHLCHVIFKFAHWRFEACSPLIVLLLFLWIHWMAVAIVTDLANVHLRLIFRNLGDVQVVLEVLFDGLVVIIVAQFTNL